jgi:hypothetical protein
LEPDFPQLEASASNAKAVTFREVFFILLSIVFAILFQAIPALYTKPMHNIQSFFQKCNFQEKNVNSLTH